MFNIGQQPSLFGEIIAIELLHLVHLLDAHTQVVLHHQARQLNAVDQYHFDIQPQRCLAGAGGEL